MVKRSKELERRLTWWKCWTRNTMYKKLSNPFISNFLHSYCNKWVHWFVWTVCSMGYRTSSHSVWTSVDWVKFSSKSQSITSYSSKIYFSLQILKTGLLTIHCPIFHLDFSLKPLCTLEINRNYQRVATHSTLSSFTLLPTNTVDCAIFMAKKVEQGQHWYIRGKEITMMKTECFIHTSPWKNRCIFKVFPFAPFTNILGCVRLVKENESIKFICFLFVSCLLVFSFFLRK